MQGTVDELKGAYRTDEFLVELTDGEKAEILRGAFENVRSGENGALIFAGNEDKMLEVLSFIKENKLSLRRLERIEPSLESLFVEVVKS